MRSRPSVLAATVALPIVLALSPARGDDDAGVELKLLPKVEKGRRETIEFEGSLERETKKKALPVATLTTKATREVVSLDEDGRASQERYELAGFRATTGGNNSWSAQGVPTKLDVSRRGKGRRGSLANNPITDMAKGLEGFELVPEIVHFLADDPDGLARVLAPDSKVEKGDEWEVDAGTLLALYGPPRAKLVEEGSKTRATLESLKNKDGKTRARITLEAKLKFSPRDDPESEARLTIKAVLRGPIDGSAPPESQEVTVSLKSDEKKETASWKLKRTPIEPEPDDADAKDDGKKKDGDKKDGKEAGPKKPEEKKDE